MSWRHRSMSRRSLALTPAYQGEHLHEEAWVLGQFALEKLRLVLASIEQRDNVANRRNL